MSISFNERLEAISNELELRRKRVIDRECEFITVKRSVNITRKLGGDVSQIFNWRGERVKPAGVVLHFKRKEQEEPS